VVQQLLVKEGQSVQKGQLVLRLADDAARADLAVAESELQLAQTKLKTRQDRLPALKATLTRWQAAAKQGAADLQSVDEAVQALRDAQSEVDIAAAEVTVAKRKAEQLRACCSATSCVRPRPASWCACWPRAAACCKAAAGGGAVAQAPSDRAGRSQRKLCDGDSRRHESPGEPLTQTAVLPGSFPQRPCCASAPSTARPGCRTTRSVAR
jgi:pyruvate/2-oxoglutarate dehydrogenase complex dihydrolipoamide acyltransferase (E2) component